MIKFSQLLVVIFLSSCSSSEFFPRLEVIPSSKNLSNIKPSIQRGEYLVNGPADCGGCHSPREPYSKNKYDRRTKLIKGKELSGNLMSENFFVKMYAQNLTPAGRISNWSDDELKVAIREGVRPDGSLIGIPMPFSVYRNMSDTDVDSIILYLRQLEPVKNVESVDSTYSVLNLFTPNNYGPEIKFVPDIDRKDRIKYGEYLAGPISHCVVCHTPLGGFPVEHQYSNQLGKGGMEFKGPWGTRIAPNITSHKDGLGSYTDEQLKKIITEGVTPYGMKLSQAMNYESYKRMTEEDLNSLIAYLRTIPPLPNEED